jgi:hypothetical protein
VSSCSTNPEKQTDGTLEAETLLTENTMNRIIGTWGTETLLTDGYGSRYVMLLTIDFEKDQQCTHVLYFKVSGKPYNTVACTYEIDINSLEIALDNGVNILGSFEGENLVLNYSRQITNAADQTLVLEKGS